MKKLSLQILLLLSSGLRFDGEYFSYRMIYRHFPSRYHNSLRVILKRVSDHGLVEKIVKNGMVYFHLTTQGVTSVTRSFRLAEEKIERWDGIWRIVISKVTIKELGFGKVQKSIYLSPYRRINKKPPAHVWYFETKTVYPFMPRELAGLTWKLDTLYDSYIAWMRKAKSYSFGKSKREQKDWFGELIRDYEAILRKDPMLPKELLLPDWPRIKAQKIFAELVKRKFGTASNAVGHV